MRRVNVQISLDPHTVQLCCSVPQPADTPTPVAIRGEQYNAAPSAKDIPGQFVTQASGRQENLPRRKPQRLRASSLSSLNRPRRLILAL